MYKKWIELGLSKGLKDLEIFAVRNRSLKLGVYQNELDQHVQSDVEVVNIRGIYNHKLSTIKFENLSTSNVDQMLDQLIENAKALTIEEPAIIFEGSPSYPEVKDEIYDFSKINVLNKIELLKDLEKTILTNKYVSQVQTSVYQENDTTTTLINSKGLYLTRRNTYAYAYAIGVFKKDDDIKTAYDIKLVKSFEQFEAKKMAEETIHKGVSKLGGSSIPSKSYPIVFSNEKFSDLLQVFSTIFSGESAYRNLTALKDKVGQKIANESFNLIDDPLHKDAYFQTPFDDEGVACKKRYVVEKGVFTGFNHNLKTAKIYNVEPTGNGFGGGISPTNLYLEPKAKSFDDIIKDIQDGVYITELVGLHAGVKTVSGDFSLQASGFKIKAGEIDHPVKMIVISGNFFDMINEIVEIGSDLKFGLSGIGSPSVYIKRLMVGGEV
ncbi:TldD/PmbA family protein [Peloplasma aerotolerans]|uniref:Metallopeptidase TldD-related protein n=1 Tax=Peloplasma aerotolerans TaxID=3044389 RepID=A0AAW6U3T5_9MOLU|nr:metallopeptidase TldD-related protein [Mariniplasma sp. M4Ah]MDI6452633.1 metallopeptidase TldD-related protein [Mariniplasma sp. M4Ah]